MAAMLIWVHGFTDSYIFIPFDPKTINRDHNLGVKIPVNLIGFGIT